MPPQRGPRGEKVSVVVWTTPDGTVCVEAYASAGVRPGTHKSAADRLAELDPEDTPQVHTVMVK